LKDCIDIFGEDREAAVIREMTKIHEEVIRAPLRILYAKYQDGKAKGEFTVCISPKNMDD